MGIAEIRARTTCNNCGNPVMVNGPLRKITCSHCSHQLQLIALKTWLPIVLAVAAWSIASASLLAPLFTSTTVESHLNWLATSVQSWPLPWWSGAIVIWTPAASITMYRASLHESDSMVKNTLAIAIGFSICLLLHHTVELGCVSCWG